MKQEMQTKKLEEIKKLKIKDIELDDNLYPRQGFNGMTAMIYSNNIKGGAIFPPVLVAEIRGKYYLIDGKHRLEAYKKLEVKEVEAKILFGMTREELFLEAVKTNLTHGFPLTRGDKIKIALRLQDMNYNNIQIAKLIYIVPSELKSYIADRVAYASVGNKPIILPKQMRHLAGKSLSKEDIKIARQVQTLNLFDRLDDFISLLKSGNINMNDDKVLSRLKSISKLLLKLNL